MTDGTKDAVDDVVKISANLSRDVVETLREVARARGTSMTEVLRRGISMEKFLLDTKRKKSKVLIEDANKVVRELLLPD